MMELYEWPPTRSQRARWALEELRAEYTSHLVDLLKGEQNSDEYREIHPLGVVPALTTHTYTMYESVAIVMQLIDLYPEKNLAPPVGSELRAAYYQWCIFACAELDPAIMMVFDNTMRPLEFMRPPGSQHEENLAEKGRYDFGVRAEMLSDQLDKRKYMLGNEFSGADIAVGHSLYMARVTGLMEDFPVLKDYYKRLRHRPCHGRIYREYE